MAARGGGHRGVRDDGAAAVHGPATARADAGRMSTRARIFMVLLALAAGDPLLPKPALPRLTDGAEFPGWPGTHEGVQLARMSPGPQDAWFARGFPGKV